MQVDAWPNMTYGIERKALAKHQSGKGVPDNVFVRGFDMLLMS
jgi:hypothetical protein